MQLKNEYLTIQTSADGAELISLCSNNPVHEYLWQAEPTFWARHSPVLFPIVGRVWDGEYRVDGRTYQLGQHGFARDMRFTLLHQSDTEVSYYLENTEETLQKYPYPFRLEIGYRLQGKSVEVLWRVINPTDQDMYFQIGAHPAFYWPGFTGKDNEPVAETGLLGWFRLSKNGHPVGRMLRKSVLTEKGCIDPAAEATVETEESGMLPLTFDLFGRDALVLEHQQVDSVELLTVDKQPYLHVDFPTALVGLWSPPGKRAPFVCIEPWYGRCDRVHYTGEYKDKDHIQHLAPHAIFEGGYVIHID